MSGFIGSSTYSPLDVLLASTRSLETQQSALQEQTTTGLISQSYSGLGTSTAAVLDLQATTNASTAYSQAITTAQGKAAAMQAALSQIASMVSSMASSTLSLSGTAQSNSVDTVAQQAKVDLQQLTAILNTSYAGDYVFSGADTANPPIADASAITSSSMYTTIGSALSGLVGSPSSGTVASVVATATAAPSNTGAGTSVYSTYLTGAGATEATSSPVSVAIGVGESVTLDMPANQISGNSASGDAMSKIIGSLALVANSTGSMAGNSTFQSLMSSVTTTLNSALSSVNQTTGDLGVTQDALTNASSAQQSLQTLLATQLNGLTNVDLPSAISKLDAVNNQLQDSYTLIGKAESLNLASYLN
jgi:flagellar hook-associated protein 3 FlgL